MTASAPRTLPVPLLTLLVLVLAVFQGASPACASDIVIRHAAAHVTNELVMLDLDAEIRFGQDAIEALASGIPLSFHLEISIREARRYLWDRERFRTRRRYTLERHALSDQYVLSNLITGERSIHPSLDGAVANLGRIRKLPLVDRAELAGDGPFAGRVRLSLDLGALPAPMLPLAYISPGWHMSSGWYKWPVDL